jgi:hypothetical protein
MATITSDLKNFRIGKNFVDAETGKTACHGEIEVNGRRYNWQSTIDISTTERVLRDAARKERKRVSLFISQAC